MIGWRGDEDGTHKHAHGSRIFWSVSLAIGLFTLRHGSLTLLYFNSIQDFFCLWNSPLAAFLVGNKITIFGTLVRIFVQNEVMRLSRASDQSVLSLIQQPIVVIVVGLETKNRELEQ